MPSLENTSMSYEEEEEGIDENYLQRVYKKEPPRNTLLKHENRRNLKDLLSRVSNADVTFEGELENENQTIGQSSPKSPKVKKKNENANRTLHESNIRNWKRFKASN